jgi:hypothetical protein
VVRSFSICNYAFYFVYIYFLYEIRLSEFHVPGIVVDWVAAPAEGSMERLKKFMEIPEEERTWPASLGRVPLSRYSKPVLSGRRAAPKRKAVQSSTSG